MDLASFIRTTPTYPYNSEERDPYNSEERKSWLTSALYCGGVPSC